jgi:hypothetical protein
MEAQSNHQKRGNMAVPFFSGQNCALHLKKYLKKNIYIQIALKI